MTDKKTGDPQLGRRVRDARRHLQLTQAQVVERMRRTPEGREHGWLSNIETGTRMPSAFDIRDLAEVLDVTTDSLLRPGAPVSADSLSADEQFLIEAFRVADDEGKDLLQTTARAVRRYVVESRGPSYQRRTPRPRLRVAEEPPSPER